MAKGKKQPLKRTKIVGYLEEMELEDGETGLQIVEDDDDDNDDFMSDPDDD